MFIVIEGSDKSGKDTQVALLAEWLRKKGFDVTTMSFPAYASETGKFISTYLRNGIQLLTDPDIAVTSSQYLEALMFQCVQTCDKYAKARLIKLIAYDGSNTTNERFVVSGRWWPSSFVYGLDGGLDEQWLHAVHDLLPFPDACILLDANPDLVKDRRAIGEDDRFERDLKKQHRISELYRKLWKEYLPDHWPVIDANASIDNVAAAVRQAIVKLRPHLKDI